MKISDAREFFVVEIREPQNREKPQTQLPRPKLVHQALLRGLNLNHGPILDRGARPSHR